MEFDIITGNVKTAIKSTQQNGRKLYTVKNQLRANEDAIADSVYCLAVLQDLLPTGNNEARLQEMERLNNQIRILAESHAYLTRLETVVENGFDC